MGDGTSLLFGLDGFRVVSVSRSAIGVRQVLIEGVAPEQACPDCGVFSAQVHARWTQQIKDLPYGAALVVCWIRRRLSLIHISEPTRLGMISYAVFCLKK